MTSPEAPPIRCFLSYARQDDLVMDFVGPFTQSLRQYAYADRGRELEIFLDRETIGWGDLAQPSIRQAVRSATVFLPLLTRRYFDRPYCREELFIFYNQALVDGVRSLLLPVVLLGDDYLTEDNPDLAVQLIVERQHRRLREAWLEGPSSSVWRRTLVALAGELVDRVEQAERSLLDVPPPADLDVPAVMAQFSRDVRSVLDEVSSVVGSFHSVLTTSGDVASLAPAAQRLRAAGRLLERLACGADRLLRAGRVTTGVTAPVAELGSLVDGVEALQTSTRRAEASDVPIRQVMVVFREGLTALRSGLRVVESWAELPNPGQ